MDETRFEELMGALNKGEPIEYECKSRLEEHLVACINKTGADGLGDPRCRAEELLQVHAEQTKNTPTVKKVGTLPDDVDENTYYKIGDEVVKFSKVPVSYDSFYIQGEFNGSDPIFGGVKLDKPVCEAICEDLASRFPDAKASEYGTYVSFTYYDVADVCHVYNILFGADGIYYNKDEEEENLLYDLKSKTWYSVCVRFDELCILDEIYSDYPNITEEGPLFDYGDYDPIVHCLFEDKYEYINSDSSVIRESESGGVLETVYDDDYYIDNNKNCIVSKAIKYIGPNTDGSNYHRFNEITFNKSECSKICDLLASLSQEDLDATSTYFSIAFNHNSDYININFRPEDIYLSDENGSVVDDTYGDPGIVIYDNSSKKWYLSRLNFGQPIYIDECCFHEIVYRNLGEKILLTLHGGIPYIRSDMTSSHRLWNAVTQSVENQVETLIEMEYQTQTPILNLSRLYSNVDFNTLGKEMDFSDVRLYSLLDMGPFAEMQPCLYVKEIFTFCEGLTNDLVHQLFSTNSYIKAIDMRSAFAGSKITKMNCNGLFVEWNKRDTAFYNDIQYLFNYCTELEEVIGLDGNKCSATSNAYGFMFDGCHKLKTLEFINIKQSLQVGSGYKWGHLLTLRSLEDLCKECVCDSSKSHTLTVGSANLAKLSDIYVKFIDSSVTSIATGEKGEVEICSSTDDGAMLIENYMLLKNWQLA